MTLERYDYRSPAEFIERVAGQVRLVEDRVYVVLTARPSTDQRIVAIEQMQTPARIDDWQDASKEIYEVMQNLPIPDRPCPPEHSALLVVVRPGLCVFGPNEGRWMSAWRYSNHVANCFGGGMILVTEHGWTDFMTNAARTEPCMAPSGDVLPFVPSR